MNSQELAKLKELQSKLEEARDRYLKFLQSKNYKISVYDSFENSEITAIHKDYLEVEQSYDYRDWVKSNSPDWAEIILFDLESLLESYKPYEN